MDPRTDSSPASAGKPAEDFPNARLPPAEWSRGPESGHISPEPNEQDCLHRHFEKQVASDPDAVAIRFGRETWTYSQLDLQANRLAVKLQSLGVGPNVLVGVHMERDPWLIVALLGILKAGGAYVPLDPAFPVARLRMIGEDSALRVLLVDASTEGILEVPGADVLRLGEEAEFSSSGSEDLPKKLGLSTDLAYIIYTSGSTGNPKGVEIRHRSAVNLVFSMVDRPGFGKGDALLAVTTISFDISVAEIFIPLLSGGTMVLAPRGVGGDGETFAEMLDEHRITFAQGTPTTWRLLLAAGWAGKKDLKIVIGGEAVDRDLANQLMERCGSLWNFYGPTETTVWSTCMRMEPRDGPVVIGTPLPGNTIYLLDDDLREVAAGEVGEICIGGDGVARGYANRPELTAEKFVPDPFSSKEGATLYRTGDLGRWHPDGMLECLGRSDQQIKLRGYRIELGEIESALKDHPSVRDAVVLVHEPEPGDQRLVSYVIPNGDMPDRIAFQTHLSRRLPDYMVPSSFVKMEAFPMTPNQKIDRKAIPLQIADQDVDACLAIPIPAIGGDSPASIIAGIWASVLGLPDVKIQDNVFKLGAHSMHVAKVHAALRSRFEKRITVARIFQHPTPESLAGYFDETPVTESALPTRVASACRDIAIIGMSARFGGARDVDTFWHNIRDGVESIRDFNDEELLAKGVSPELIADKRYVKRGCVLEDHESFDAGFFEMSPREAEITNPQHRVFLQAAWETLEHSGYVPETFDGAIGLFAGAGHNVHAHATEDLSGVEYLQYLVGNEQDYLTTRTAYKLGFTGPALNIQTACSTSLVAIHAACHALFTGQCDMAIAGGVSISWPEGKGYLHGEGLIFSKDGKCRVFDAEASGTVFGHGVGLVALKNLDRAIADGDTIHAVIRGIAINNDGSRKGSFAAPSIDGQAEVIAAALAQQGIHPDTIGFMEAHGTGTAVGDPIELAGLTKAYRLWTDRKQYCSIGSVKTNIGHTDAAAGSAGLIKAVMALKHRELPPILHFEEPNPDLDLENSPFRVQTTRASWVSETPRRAAVSSFGLGGTNAHAVLEEYPRELLVTSTISRTFKLLPFSARSQVSFDRFAGKWTSFLNENPQLNLADAAYTLQNGRAEFDLRGFIVAESGSDALKQFEAGELRNQTSAVTHREVVFLFTGQGAQYAGMAKETYFNEPVFSRELDRCSEILEPKLGFKLVDALYGDQAVDDFHQTSLAQPALFAIAYAQAKLWMEWGVKPACMLGHSIGEYVAATIAGVFSLEDALHLVAERGRLMQSMQAGAMLAVMHPRAEVMRLLEDFPELDLAAANAPELCVVAGTHDAVAGFSHFLGSREITNRILHTSHAFHSRMMDGMLQEFQEIVASVTRNPPLIPYLSNVSGDWITAADAVDPHYYANHIRQTVCFSDCIERLLEKPERLFLEMGPGRTLVTFVNKHITRPDSTLAFATMPGAQEGIPSSRLLMEALGKAWASGLKVKWKNLYQEETRRRIPLPTYPFDEKPYRLSNDPKGAHGPSAKNEKISDIGEWFYSPGWRHQPRVIQKSDASGCWLLGNIPTEISELISSPLLIQAEPGDETGFESIIAKMASEDRLPAKVIIGWTLDRTPFVPEARMVDDGCLQTMKTVRALALAWNKHAGDKRLCIHFLTSGYHDISGIEPAQPHWSFLTASCLVATQEFPSIRCRHIDLPLDAMPRAIASEILADCMMPDDEATVAWRGGRRWIRSFAKVKLEEPPALPYRDAGVYLITGGLGRVGLLFAEHLAKQAKAKLVLLGRSEPDPTAQEAISNIEQLGGEVMFIKADSGSLDDMNHAISAARKKFGAIHGIIHAAGVISSQPIVGSTADDLNHYLHAKTHGVIAIHQATRSLKLDFCLLTSSLSAVLGGLGYHGYAAGNAFLDQFARWANQDSGFPWISINWDAWRFANDATSGLGSAMYRMAMTPLESTQVLDRILSSPGICSEGMLISTAPLAPRLDQWVHGPARREGSPTMAASIAAPTGTAIERMTLLWKNCLRREVAAEDDYFELGGDSLMAVGLFTEIERQFGKSLPISSLFQSPTPAKLLSLVTDVSEPAIPAKSYETVKTGPIPKHVIAIRESGMRRPLFCIHGADGGVLFYRDFGLRLDPDRPFYAIEAPMIQDSSLNAGEDVASIAKAYLSDIRKIQPEGPYLLGGYSFGGIVAFEMARQLKAEGIATSMLLLFDSPNPASPVRRFTLRERVSAQWQQQGNSNFWAKLANLALRVVSGSIFRMRLEIENRLAARQQPTDRGYLRHIQSRQQHDALYDAYVPQPYDGPTHLFIAQAGGGDKFAYERNLGWSDTLINNLAVSEVPGSHLEVFREPYLAELIKQTRTALLDQD